MLKRNAYQLKNALIKEMRLQEFTNKIRGRLSGGNKGKLSIAISILCNPPLILLDEPKQKWSLKQEDSCVQL